MEYGGEGFENDSLLRILQPEAFRLILVLTIERFDRDVFLKRRPKVLDALDGELYICTSQLVMCIVVRVSSP